MFVDNSKYKSFGGRDPIIHNFTVNDEWYVRNDFVDALYTIFEEFCLKSLTKNELIEGVALTTLIDTPFITAEQVMEKYYISRPWGYNITSESFHDKRMSYTFFNECVTLLNMFQNDNTNPIKLNQKRLTTILKTYWTTDRFEKLYKINMSKDHIEPHPFSFDKGYQISSLIERLLTEDRVNLGWIKFEDVVRLPLDLAYDNEGNLNLIHPRNMLHQLAFGWVNYLSSYKDHPALNVANLKAEARKMKDQNKSSVSWDTAIK